MAQTKERRRIVAYLDADTWIAPFEPAEWPPETLKAIETIIEWQHAGKIELVTSARIHADLEGLLLKPTKAKKAAAGLRLLNSLDLRRLQYSAGYFDNPVKGGYDESRYDSAEKLQDSNLHDSQDRDALDFIPLNNVDYFVTLDEELHRKKVKEIQRLLQTEGTQVVTPRDFVMLVRSSLPS